MLVDNSGSAPGGNYNNTENQPLYEDLRHVVGEGQQHEAPGGNYNNTENQPLYEDLRHVVGEGQQHEAPGGNYNNTQSSPSQSRAPSYGNDINELLATVSSRPPSVEAQEKATSLWALDAHLRAKHGLAPAFPSTKQLAMREFTTTKYLTPLESQSKTLAFRGGLLMRRVAPGPDQPPGKWQLEPYDTTDIQNTMHGNESERGQALYVLSQGGTLLSAPGKVQETHHSTLLAGTEVAGAGMMRVENGKIRSISNASGHYRPTADYLRNVFKVFERNHVNLDEIEVEEALNSTCNRSHLNGHRRNWASATEWLAFHDEPAEDTQGPPPQSIGYQSSAPPSDE
ncbi:hypothetical protein [Acidimicrobium ferrooxidans]|nr:hypothetical protein [Acidimicrobium ferrooxidans]